MSRLFLLFLSLLFSNVQLFAASVKSDYLVTTKSKVVLEEVDILGDDYPEILINSNFSVTNLNSDLDKDTVAAHSRKSAIVKRLSLQKSGSKNSADTHSAETVNSTNEFNETNASAVLYITPGATMVGAENIYNAKVVEKKGKVSRVLKKEQKSSLALQIDFINAEKKEESSAVKKELEKAVQKKTDFSFSTFPAGNADFRNQSPAFFGAAIPTSQFSHYATLVADSSETTKISKELKNQKFRTSLSYLQFGKLRNSFLRGPPSLS